MTGEEVVRRAGMAAWLLTHPRVVPPPEPEPEDPHACLPLPRHPDPLVFGAPDAIGTRDPDVAAMAAVWPLHFCGRCGVGWSEDAACWNCAR